MTDFNITHQLDYETALEMTGDAKAAAILVLASAVYSLTNDVLGHQICMGIRHGLMGAGADGDANLGDYFPGSDA